MIYEIIVSYWQPANEMRATLMSKDAGGNIKNSRVISAIKVSETPGNGMEWGTAKGRATAEANAAAEAVRFLGHDCQVKIRQ